MKLPARSAWTGGGNVAKKRAGRASWFKLFLHQKALIDAVPDEAVGKALKAALSYFDTGEIPTLNSLENAVFSSLKQYADEAIQDYRKFSEAGKMGNEKRWGPEVSPPDTPRHQVSPPIAPYREAEADKEADKDAEAVTGRPPMASITEMAEDRKLKLFGGELGKNVVFLSEQQIADLLEKMGLDAFDYYVDRLATYILNTGAKPKNHHATILKWWRQDSEV